MTILSMLKNDNGTWSHTRCLLIITYILAVTLILCEVIFGGVLSVTVMISLLGLYIFNIMDRINARNMEVRFGKDGATVSLGDGGKP